MIRVAVDALGGDSGPEPIVSGAAQAASAEIEPILFGPAGRPLPQLPLAVDREGALRAGGGFSGPVGPSWWGVQEG